MSSVPRQPPLNVVQIGDTKIRVHGIEAPESKQTCQKADGSKYRCGVMTTFALAKIIEIHLGTYKGDVVTRYKRRIAVCYAGQRCDGQARLPVGPEDYSASRRRCLAKGVWSTPR